MRHRLLVNLYDSNPLEAELLDYLSEYDRNTRQKIHRFLLLAGFNSVVKRNDPASSAMGALDPEIMNAMARLLSGLSSDAPNQLKVANQCLRENIEPVGHARVESLHEGMTARAKSAEKPPSDAAAHRQRMIVVDESGQPMPTPPSGDEVDLSKEVDDELDPLERLRRMSNIKRE